MHPPEEVAQQFFGQALIEPLVMGAYQILPTLPPDGVCWDDTRLTEKECEGPGDALYRVLADASLSAELFGSRLEDVAGLSGPNRHGVRLPGDQGTQADALNAALVQRMGGVDIGDYYFGEGPSSGGPDWFADKTVVPPAFVDNLAYVRTLITIGTYDGIVDSKEIAPALVAYGVPARLDLTPRRDTPRAGSLFVTLPGGRTASVRMPTYAGGHAISRTQALPLRADIADWFGLPL